MTAPKKAQKFPKYVADVRPRTVCLTGVSAVYFHNGFECALFAPTVKDLARMWDLLGFKPLSRKKVQRIAVLQKTRLMRKKRVAVTSSPEQT